MTDRFLVMGDNHGDVESLRRVLDDVSDETVDYVIHVGDFTDAWRTARQTENESRGKERGVEQLEKVEPVLEEFDALAEHGLFWVYGNQDYFGGLDYTLSAGTEIPDDGVISVGNLQFTSSLAHVAPDIVLVTHMEYWRLADHFDGLAHFCGNSHRGRHKGRRLNSSYLQIRDPETDRKRFGGYFMVELSEGSHLQVEMRSLGELTRIECDQHAERGVQFQPETRGCMYCNEDGTLFREICASAFYGLTHDSDRDTVTDGELIEYAETLWNQPPDGFREKFQSYLTSLENHRYVPLTRTEEGTIRLADKSYAY